MTTVSLKPQPGSHIDEVMTFVNRKTTKPEPAKQGHPHPKPVAQPSGKVKPFSEKLAKLQRPGDQLRAALNAKQGKEAQQ